MGDWYSFREPEQPSLWFRFVRSLVGYECDCDRCEHNTVEEEEK